MARLADLCFKLFCLLFCISIYALACDSIAATKSNSSGFRAPTELPGYYNVQYYQAVILADPDIRLHVYGTPNVSEWMLTQVSAMVQNIINSMNYASHREQFNDHHIFVITDDDPDVPYSSLPGHKNTGTIGFTILNQTLICAEAVDTLYPDLPPTWRAWDTPIHEFGHAIEHTLALESYSDSVFRSAESNYDPQVSREYFSWFNEVWFDANLSTDDSGQSLPAKRSTLHESFLGYYRWLFDVDSIWKPSCEGRPDSINSIKLKQLVGKYKRAPAENNWHQVEVPTEQNQNLVLDKRSR